MPHALSGELCRREHFLCEFIVRNGKHCGRGSPAEIHPLGEKEFQHKIWSLCSLDAADCHKNEPPNLTPAFWPSGHCNKAFAMDDLEKTLQQVALARESTLILRDGFGGWSKFKLSLSPTDSSLPTFPGGPHRLLFRPTNFPPSPILLNIGPSRSVATQANVSV